MIVCPSAACCQRRDLEQSSVEMHSRALELQLCACMRIAGAASLITELGARYEATRSTFTACSAPRRPMKRRSPVLIKGPRVSSSIQKQLAALRVAIGGYDVHCCPFVRVSRFKRCPAAEQNLRHLEVSLPDCQHKRCPPVGVSLVDEPPDLEVRLDVVQTSLSGCFVYVYFASRWLANRWLVRLRGHFSSKIIRSLSFSSGISKGQNGFSARAEIRGSAMLISTTYR